MKVRYDPPSANEYIKCLQCQSGGGIPYYDGTIYQRGYGIGGLFRGLMSGLLPLLPKAAKFLGKTAIKVVGDRIKGVPISESIKTRGINAGRTFLLNALKGKGPTKRKRKKTITKQHRFINKRTKKTNNPFA